MISVLYVDDDRDLLSLGKVFLERFGDFSVFTKDAVSDALLLLNTVKFDAIISDYQMPVINGLEFLREVRRSHDNIPFILFTGKGREEVVIQALNIGADFYLQKGGDPIPQYTELAHKIRQAVQRRRAEISLKESECRYRDVVETQTEFICRYKPDGTHLFVNEAYCRFFGKKREDVIGRRFIPVIPEEEREMIRTHFASFTVEKPVAEIEHRVIMPDGRTCWQWWSDHAIFDDNGMIIEYQSIGRDITIQKQTQTALSESESRWRQWLEQSPVPMALSRLDGTVLYSNKRFVSTVGYSMEDVPHWNYWWPLVHPDPEYRQEMFNEFGKRLRKAISSGEYLEPLEADIRCKDGTVRVLEFSGLVIGDTFLETCYDLTYRKTMENALRESEEKFRVLADNAPAAITVVQDNRYVYVNNHTVSATGYSKEELYSMNFWDLIHPDQKGRIIDHSRAWMRGEWSSGSSELKYVTKSGEVRWAFATSAEIMYGGKRAAISMIIGITDRKYAEEELRAAYEQLEASDEELHAQYAELQEQLKITRQRESDYQSIIENIQDGFYRTDIEGFFQIVSPSFARMFGYANPEEITGKNIRDTIYHNPSDREVLLKILEKDGKAVLDCIPLQHRNGSPIPASVSSHLLYDEDGNPTCIEGIIHNNTGSAKAEEVRLKSEKNFRNLLDNLPDLVLVHRNGIIRYVNQAMTDAMGITPAHILNKPFIDHIPPEYHTLVADAAQKQMETGDVEPYEIELISCIRGRRRVLIRGSTIEFDDSPAILNVLTDITHKKDAERARYESGEKFRSFMENADEIVFSLAPDGTYTYISPNWTESLGYDQGEIIGIQSAQFVHPDDIPRNREVFINAVTSGKKSSDVEYRIKHKNNTWHWYSQSISPVRDQNGKIVAVQGICHDITDRKNNESVKRQANRQFNLLTSITRHDILNQVTIGLIYLDDARMRCKDPEICNCLLKIQSAIEAIQSLIGFTRIYEDPGIHEPQWQEIGAVMPYSSIPASVSLTADVKGISIFAVPMLKKVFFNLFEYSVRHRQHVTQIRVSAYQSDEGLTVVWEDNGDGVPEDEKEKIFDRRFGKSTGFGIFLVREILSLTGITILENGIPGTGSRFEITIPTGVFRIKEPQ